MPQSSFVLVSNETKNGSIKFYEAIQILLASCFIGLCAQIKVPLGLVPFTGQTFGVMLVGAFLGKKEGALTALIYLIQGALGFPVFAGGSFGLHHLLGPTGGYLLFYPIEAYLFGWSIRSLNYPFFKSISACTLQLMVGSLWLGLFVGIKCAFANGFYPFIFVEVIKVFSVYCLYLKQRRSSSCHL